VEITNQADIDAYLEELDSSMNPASVDDFGENQLSDSELGL
jgi:hypothetical protein